MQAIAVTAVLFIFSAFSSIDIDDFAVLDDVTLSVTMKAITRILTRWFKLRRGR